MKVTSVRFWQVQAGTKNVVFHFTTKQSFNVQGLTRNHKTSQGCSKARSEWNRHNPTPHSGINVLEDRLNSISAVFGHFCAFSHWSSGKWKTIVCFRKNLRHQPKGKNFTNCCLQPTRNRQNASHCTNVQVRAFCCLIVFQKFLEEMSLFGH